MNVPEYIILHHTGGTRKDLLFDTSNHTFEIVDNYHKSLGWEGFGYHWFIEKDGKLREGRKEDYHGAHTRGYNLKSIGVCLAGNFDATIPTKAQENTLKTLLVDIQTRWKIPIKKIVPHREFATKTCYGRRLADDWGRNLLKPVFPKKEILAEIDRLREFVYWL